MQKSERLKSNHQFSLVCRRGRKYNARHLVLFVLKRRGRGEKRVGFAVSKQFDKAVARNRAKRLLREAWRSLEGELTCEPACAYDLVLLHRLPDAESKAPLTLLITELHALLRKAGLVVERHGDA